MHRIHSISSCFTPNEKKTQPELNPCPPEYESRRPDHSTPPHPTLIAYFLNRNWGWLCGPFRLTSPPFSLDVTTGLFQHTSPVIYLSGHGEIRRFSNPSPSSNAIHPVMSPPDCSDITAPSYMVERSQRMFTFPQTEPNDRCNPPTIQTSGRVSREACYPNRCHSPRDVATRPFRHTSPVIYGQAALANFDISSKLSPTIHVIHTPDKKTAGRVSLGGKAGCTH